MLDPETLALRATVIGGQKYADDFTVILRELQRRLLRCQPL